MGDNLLKINISLSIVLLFFLSINFIASSQGADSNSSDNHAIANQSSEFTKSAIDSLSSLLEKKISAIDSLNQLSLLREAEKSFEATGLIVSFVEIFLGIFTLLLIIGGYLGWRQFGKVVEMKDDINKIKHEIEQTNQQLKSSLLKVEDHYHELINNYQDINELAYNLNEGISNYRTGKYQYSRELLSLAIEKISKLPSSLNFNNEKLKALYYIGRSYSLEEEVEKADNYFHKMIEIDEKFSRSYIGIALNHLLSDKEKAVVNCKKAEVLAQKNEYSTTVIGYIYRTLNLLDDSLKVLRVADSINSTSTTSYYLGTVFLAKNQLAEAFKYFDKSKGLAIIEIDKSKEIGWAYYKMAVVSALYNNTEEAKKHIKSVLDFNDTKEFKRLMKIDLLFLKKHTDGKNRENINLLHDLIK
jgi:tetratricopeptide (TPR) repeat protein